MALFSGALTAEDVYRLVRAGYTRHTRHQAREWLDDRGIELAERKRPYWLWMEFCHDRRCEPRGELPPFQASGR